MIAFLIMCHKNGQQVIRLVNCLVSSESEIFIHVDSTMPEEDYGVIKEYVERHNEYVHLTEHRLHGILDDRSLVDIAMELIKTAQKEEKCKNKHFLYYSLLSGQDYPLKTIQFINSQLKSSYPRPFIDCTAWSPTNWVSKKFSKNVHLLRYREWIKVHFPKEKTFGWIVMRSIGYAWRRFLQMTHRTDGDWLKNNGIKLYGGSAWWILPDRTINYILHEYDTQPEYVRRLLKTYTPEETFFQILAQRGPNAEMIKLNETEGKIQDSMTYAYFYDDDKSFVGHPYTITEKVIPNLFNSNYWFARKFDVEHCKLAMDYIDEHLKK